MFLFGRKKASGKPAKQQVVDEKRDVPVQEGTPAQQGEAAQQSAAQRTAAAQQSAPAQQGASQNGEETVDVRAGSPEDAFFSELNDVNSSLVSLVLEGLGRVDLADEADVIYVYGYIGDDRPVFDSFCLMNGGCKELPDLLGNDLFGQVFDIALDDLARLQEAFRRHGQPMPVEVRGRYDARSGGFNAAFPHDAFDRGERDAGIFDRFYGWMDDVNAGRDDLAR